MVSRKLNVKGTAIRAGVSRNKMKYVPEELSPYAPTLSSRPIMKDHKGEVDSTVGLVTNSYTRDNGESVEFEGWLKDDNTGVLEKVEDGRIKEVSIGAMAARVVKESEDSEELIPRGLTAIELSLTPIPGVIGTSITQALTESYNDFRKIDERKVNKMDIKEQMKCPECGEEFADKDKLAKHKEAEHMEEEKASVQLKESMKEAEKTLKEARELRLSLLKEKYEVLCEKKKMKPSTFVTEEELKALIKVTESIELPKVQETQVENKAEFKSRVPTPADISKVEEIYGGFTFENSEFGKGVAFYRETIDHPRFQSPKQSAYKTSVKNN